MSIKIGQASADENRRASGGAAGDQTGGEVHIRTWYSSPWDCVLRPKSPELAEKSAAACEAACANNKIGYDQGSRNTLYIFAKLYNFDLAAITDSCECDCSTLMHVCAIAGGAKLSYGINGMWTGNMVEGFTANGEYEVLREAKYLTSDAFLRRGDILLNSKSHTAMALENGAMVGDDAAGASPRPAPEDEIKSIIKPVTGTVMLVPLPLLKKGDRGWAVFSLQILLLERHGFDTKGVDGIFGDDTEAAVMELQELYGAEVDGEVGKETWPLVING